MCAWYSHPELSSKCMKTKIHELLWQPYSNEVNVSDVNEVSKIDNDVGVVLGECSEGHNS